MIAGIGAALAVTVLVMPLELWVGRTGLHLNVLVPVYGLLANSPLVDLSVLILVYWLASIVYAFVFQLLYPCIPGRGVVKGLWFALIVFLMGMPWRFDILSTLDVPRTLHIWWMLLMVYELLVMGVVFGWVYRDYGETWMKKEMRQLKKLCKR